MNLSDVKMESLLHNTCMEFYTQFEKAMKGFGIDRMEAGARAMILFSGGVDSLFVALTAAHLAPPESEVVLVNVAFGNTVQVKYMYFSHCSISTYKFLICYNANRP